MPNTTFDIIISRKCVYKIHTLQFPSANYSNFNLQEFLDKATSTQ